MLAAACLAFSLYRRQLLHVCRAKYNTNVAPDQQEHCRVDLNKATERLFHVGEDDECRRHHDDGNAYKNSTMNYQEGEKGIRGNRGTHRKTRDL